MVCAVCDILWIYVLMEVTRLVFLWENIGSFRITFSSFMLISHGGLLFDTSAIMYVNALWLILAFLPLHLKERPGWWKAVKWTYVVTNSVALPRQSMRHGFLRLPSPAEHHVAVHRIRQRREHSQNHRNGGPDALVSAGIAYRVMIWSMWKLCSAILDAVRRNHSRHYYLGNTLRLGFWVAFFIFGVRGCTFSSVTRPIAVGYAQSGSPPIPRTWTLC